MTPPTTSLLEPSTRDLIHAVNNFLNVVVVTGEIGLDAKLDYSPERALRSILEGAEELAAFVRKSRGQEV